MKYTHIGGIEHVRPIDMNYKEILVSRRDMKDEIIIKELKCPVCGMTVQYDARNLDEREALIDHIKRLDMNIILQKYGY